MQKIINIIAALAAFVVAFCSAAQAATISDISIKGKTYTLEYSNESLTAKNGAELIKGKQETGVKTGDFSQWLFKTGAKDAFEVIVNTKTLKVIDVKPDAEDAGGPYFAGYATYLMLDYGCCPDPREFKLFDANGNVVYQDDYFSDSPYGFKVIKGELTLVYTGSSGVTDKKEIKKCDMLGMGNPVMPETRYFNIKKKIVVRTEKHPEDITCTQ